MGIWDILGIGPTVDLSAIKSAYALRAKLVHPEEHPEEFQQLQQAYKSAVKYAKAARNAAKPMDSAVRQEPQEAHKPVAQEKPAPAVHQKPVVPRKSERAVQQETQNPLVQPDKQKISVKIETMPPVDGQSKTQPKAADRITKPKSAADQKTEPEKSLDAAAEPEFSYDEVVREELNSRFIQEMASLGKNPYIKNKVECWQWFLNRQEYQSLYQDDALRRNLVMSMQTIKGWDRKVIKYVDGFLKQFQGDLQGKPETDHFGWKYLQHYHFLRTLLSDERNITKEQQRMQKVILGRLMAKGYSGDWTEGDHFFAYLETYLGFAADNRESIDKMYNDNIFRRQSGCYMVVGFVLSILMIIYFTVAGASHKADTEQKKRNEQWEQEKLENLKEWNQNPQSQSIEVHIWDEMPQ